MGTINRCLIISCVVMLSACFTTQIPKEDIQNIGSIKIVNYFPDSPFYTNYNSIWVDTPISIEDKSFKLFLNSEIEKQLRKRGYKIVSSASQNADLILEVVPVKDSRSPGTIGFGYYNESFLGMNMAKVSYVTMKINPIVDGDVKCERCFGGSQTELPIEDMPETWGELSVKEKSEFKEILRDDIKKAVNMAIQNTGL